MRTTDAVRRLVRICNGLLVNAKEWCVVVCEQGERHGAERKYLTLGQMLPCLCASQRRAQLLPCVQRGRGEATEETSPAQEDAPGISGHSSIACVSLAMLWSCHQHRLPCACCLGTARGTLHSWEDQKYCRQQEKGCGCVCVCAVSLHAQSPALVCSFFWFPTL